MGRDQHSCLSFTQLWTNSAIYQTLEFWSFDLLKQNATSLSIVGQTKAVAVIKMTCEHNPKHMLWRLWCTGGHKRQVSLYSSSCCTVNHAFKKYMYWNRQPLLLWTPPSPHTHSTLAVPSWVPWGGEKMVWGQSYWQLRGRTWLWGLTTNKPSWSYRD